MIYGSSIINLVYITFLSICNVLSWNGFHSLIHDHSIDARFSTIHCVCECVRLAPQHVLVCVFLYFSHFNLKCVCGHFFVFLSPQRVYAFVRVCQSLDACMIMPTNETQRVLTSSIDWRTQWRTCIQILAYFISRNWLIHFGFWCCRFICCIVHICIYLWWSNWRMLC